MPPTENPPNFIAITSMGLTPASHKVLPGPWKLFYGYALQQPHQDKVAVERVAAHVAGWTWDPVADGKVEEDVIGKDWEATVPPAGSLKNHIVIVRPALLTDGECKEDQEQEKAQKSGKAPKPGYRVEEEDLPGTYLVSRKDTAHFIAEKVIKHWDEYAGKRWTVGY